MSFRSAVTNTDQERDQFHLVGFEPAYGYRRHGQGQAQDDEDDEDEEDSEFIEWARIMGDNGGESTPSGMGGGGNQHRRLGEASARDDMEAGQQARDTPTARENREFSGKN